MSDSTKHRVMPLPDGAQQVRAERDRTREELGQTVQALAEKFDVRGRARDSVHQKVESARAMAGQVTDRAKGRAEDAKTQARQLKDRAAGAPDQVVERGKQVGGAARRNPAPFAGGVVAVVVALLVWQWSRRRVER
jgi:septal ring factor EnvC (AmiA/AmiB activator)